MSTKGYQLTPEQLALSEERKRLKLLKKKDQEAQHKPSLVNDPRAKILEREWLQLDRLGSHSGLAQFESCGPDVKIKVMTWNVRFLLFQSYRLSDI